MDDDRERPDNVIPFGNEIRSTIARLMRESYAQLVSEELPENIVALFRRFEETSKNQPTPKESGPEPGTRPAAPEQS